MTEKQFTVPPEKLIDELLDQRKAGDALRQFVKNHPDKIRPGCRQWYKYTDGIKTFPDFEKSKRAEAKEHVLHHTYDRIRDGGSPRGRPVRPPQLDEIVERKNELEILQWQSEAFVEALPEIVERLCTLYDRAGKLKKLGNRQQKHFEKAVDAAEAMGKELSKTFELYKNYQTEIKELNRAGLTVRSDHAYDPAGIRGLITKVQIETFVDSVRDTFNYESTSEQREQVKTEKDKAAKEREQYISEHREAVKSFRNTAKGKSLWGKVRQIQEVLSNLDDRRFDDAELLNTKKALRESLQSFYTSADESCGVKPQEIYWAMPSI
ncbi:MAG: hypothetical protein KAV00_03655 [Phycisphaerae bacterium]|nr:hypothetical protein [Phycisphaerae bacterium]